MKKKYIISFFISLLFISCESDADIDDVPYEPKIVVEGSIEHGEFASVLLTRSAPIVSVHDSIKLKDYAIRTAKVIVSDGDTYEVLPLRYNPNRFPPYEYKGEIIRGETGKTYTLKVEYRDQVITGTTHIPNPASLDRIYFKRNNPTDTIGYINVIFNNISEEYYHFATKYYSSKGTFTPCLYGNIDSQNYPKNEQINLDLIKGPSIYPKNDFKTYYALSDTIMIKFSTIPQSAYTFWTSYQDEILNAQNIVFPAFSSLQSNVSGGIGVWSGYGSNIYSVKLSEIEE